MNPPEMARRNLEQKLRPMRGLTRPPYGWVKAIREALGMTAKQLAERLGVSPTRVHAIEKGEVKGSLSLDTLSRAAEALDCTLVYVLVPHAALEELVRARARQKAAAMLTRVDHTMRLEDQGLEEGDKAAALDRLTDELLRGNPKRLWDSGD